MNKLLNSLGLLVAAAALSTLAGCDLYYGNGGGGGGYTYCAADGEHSCDSNNNCHWVSSTCSDSGSGSGSSTGSGSGSGSGSGYQCTSSSQCAAGCYCSGGVCTEGGFCTSNADCGPGYICDTNRSSCEPGCTQNSDCASGQVCDTSTSTCTVGSCGGAITCTTAAPQCATGQVPTIVNGCYTGNCEAYASCDTPPVCANINDEADCLGRTDCGATYTGIDCTKADGSACKSGDTGCTCASFQFATCVSK
jgi:Cys-rich repeat protein